jgi:hypothetical protein
MEGKNTHYGPEAGKEKVRHGQEVVGQALSFFHEGKSPNKIYGVSGHV